MINPGVYKNYIYKNKNKNICIHAEIDLIRNNRKLIKRRKVDILIVRIVNNEVTNNLSMSKPCESCYKSIKKYKNIRYVYYSDNGKIYRYRN